MLAPVRCRTSASAPWFWRGHACDVPRIKCDTERSARRVPKSTPGDRTVLPAGPLPSVGRPLHRLEVQDAVRLEVAMRISGDHEVVAPFQGVLLDAPPLQRARRLPFEDVETSFLVLDLDQRVRRSPVELLQHALHFDE